MFQQQQSQRKTHIMTPAIASQNEAQAKEKLSGYVYEYLVHVGAPKAAEVFKSELLSQQHITQITPGDFPGFLHNWWCVFWDLYSAAPERRNKYDPSQEAKAFHEYGFIPPSTYGSGPLINGVHPNPQFNNGGAPQLSSMGMPFNSDGMISNYFGSRSGNQPVSSTVQSNQASPIAGTRYLGGHSNTVGPRSGAPTPSNILNSGGSTGPSNFSSGSQNAHIFTNDQQVRNISQRINTNPNRIPFSINHHDGINTPTSCSGNSGSNNASGFNGMQLGNGTNNDNSNPSVSGIGGQLQNILNGGDSVALVEMKQSPISHMNGNTPITNPNSIQQQGIGGPASVHGVHVDSASVQSQSSSSLVVAGPSSQQPHGESTQSTTIDFQQNNVRSVTGSGEVEEMEISKIKASLIEDYGPGNYGSV